MSANEKDLVEAALKLPKKSRARIADKLLESLEVQAALDDAIEEAERRWQAYKRGEVKCIPAEEIFPSLKKLRKRK
jgi:putative addiction module component (TIGR02574 family)